MNEKHMQVILVEDDPKLRPEITAALVARFSELIVVNDLVDWPEAKKRLPDLLKNAHLVFSDMNLKGEQDNADDKEFLRTEFDGLRVFGLTRKHNASIPIILYTGHELQQNALDQLDDPNGPVWVLKKTGDLDIEACVDRLSTVAEGIIRSVGLEVRQKVYGLLAEGDKDVLDEPVLDGGPCWRSVLAVISARAGPLGLKTLLPKAFAEVLAKFLPSQPFKFSLLCRMLKPKDYLWLPNAETYGIRVPKNRIVTERAAWEQLLHPTKDEFNSDNERWRTGWDDAIADAGRELKGTHSALLEKTVLMLENCLEAAKTLRDVSEGNNSDFLKALRDYSNGPVKTVNESLRSDLQSGDRTWGEAIKKLWDKETSHIDILSFKFCAEWEHIIRGIGYVCASSDKHSNSKYKLRGNIAKLASLGKWRLSLIITDEGPGIKEFAATFTRAADAKPTENVDQNHKLRLAQGSLWGYCDWRVLTKREQESVARFYDVFGVRNEMDPEENQLIQLAQEVGRRRSGTAHILDFICPLPEPGSHIEVKDATLDLR